MDVNSVKRNIQYILHLDKIEAILKVSSIERNRVLSRKRLFNWILDAADALRREYGENLENLK